MLLGRELTMVLTFEGPVPPAPSSGETQGFLPSAGILPTLYLGAQIPNLRGNLMPFSVYTSRLIFH